MLAFGTATLFAHTLIKLADDAATLGKGITKLISMQIISEEDKWTLTSINNWVSSLIGPLWHLLIVNDKLDSLS